MVPSFVLTEQATIYAVGGVQQEKPGALCEQCQGELCWPSLQSWISSEGISLYLIRAREKQQRA